MEAARSSPLPLSSPSRLDGETAAPSMPAVSGRGKRQRKTAGVADAAATFEARLQGSETPEEILQLLEAWLVGPLSSILPTTKYSWGGRSQRPPPSRDLSVDQAEAVVLKLAAAIRRAQGDADADVWRGGLAAAGKRGSTLWRDVGGLVSGLIATGWEGGAYRRIGDGDGPPAGAASSSLRATELLEAVVAIGPAFYSKALADSLLAAVESEGTHQPAASREDADLLCRALCACARCGHLVRHSALARVSRALLRGCLAAPGSTAAVSVDVLWALGRYRVRLQEHSDADVQAVTDALSRLGRAWSPPSRPSSLDSVACERKEECRLGLEEATQLATALADLELQPEVSAF